MMILLLHFFVSVDIFCSGQFQIEDMDVCTPCSHGCDHVDQEKDTEAIKNALGG